MNLFQEQDFTKLKGWTWSSELPVWHISMRFLQPVKQYIALNFNCKLNGKMQKLWFYE